MVDIHVSAISVNVKYQEKTFGRYVVCATKKKCRGRIHVSNVEKIKYMDHNHVLDISKIEVKIQVNGITLNVIDWTITTMTSLSIMIKQKKT